MRTGELQTTLNPLLREVHFSDRWRSWRPTQPWLAEIIRAAVASNYSELLQNDESNPRGVHRNALNAHISKAFGALLSAERPDLSIPTAVDLLVRFGDLADIGEGYLIPRESRIVVFPGLWGRIAGGLPLPLSEHVEVGVLNPRISTVGRIVETNEQFEAACPDTEHSEVLSWTNKSPDEIFTILSRRLPEQESMAPVETSMRFYHAGIKTTTRRDRWQMAPPREVFSVARTVIQPVRYFLRFPAKSGRSRWFFVQRDDARKWLLLAERYCLTTSRIRIEKTDGHFRARIPDMLPDSWTVALLASGSAVIPVETGWDVTVFNEVWPLFHALLKAANVRTS